MDNSTVILLVEDEVLVRMLAADVLSEAGFTVLESTNAQEALTLLEARPDVQVLFTDVNIRARWTVLAWRRPCTNDRPGSAS